MYLAHRYSGVGLRSTECGSEELDLPARQPGHVGAGEEPGEFCVGEHAIVEVGDDDFQRLVTADLVVDACHGRKVNAHPVAYEFHLIARSEIPLHTGAEAV